MSEEKKLDEKKLEEVAGGELLEYSGLNLPTGSCVNCASSGPNCPFIKNQNFMLELASGKGICYSFTPKS